MDLLLERHSKEQTELAATIKALLKAAKKSQRAEVEAQCIQRQYDLKAQQSNEIDLFESGELVELSPEVVEAHNTDETVAVAESAVDKVTSKKAKNQRKKERRVERESERELEKGKIVVGPDMREIELQQLHLQLNPLHLKVKDIISDGHCLYRAVADQLRLQASSSLYSDLPFTAATVTFNDMRRLASSYLRSHSTEFAPFLGFEVGQEYDDYCSLVENSIAAEWGGQLELRALSCALRKCIHVFEANVPLLRIGEEFADPQPLLLSFHRHYFALGEHYNSVIPV